ncbi:geranylgeranyl transferase type-2 subunit beta [Physcia stellaris]|nr:geranylgeranyl transferase type-2 subunit beta [Physcia stellaris]
MYESHPSLSASLEDFENNENRSPLFGLPSQHSGFKSEDSDADAESVSEEPWSPPAWRNSATGGWYRHQPYPGSDPTKLSQSPSRSRQTSPQHEDIRGAEDDTLIPANIPLPQGSRSPTKERSPSPQPFAGGGQDFGQQFEQAEEPAPSPPENGNNYIRFAVRAEVQHRTEPIEAFLTYVRTYTTNASKSWTSLSTTIAILLLAIFTLRLLTHTPSLPPVPDLVKVAGLARSFEPLIHYSENGIRQIGDLQETGVAVWDLGESVRSANMTSAPLIVNELDALSESLKTLGIELTKFFANVDGDIDGILIVMEWAQRELSALSTLPLGGLSSAFTNIHSLLSTLGVLESRSTHRPTTLGKAFTALFGATHSQRTHQTLQRTFTEFLSVLEDSINSELTYSTTLFSLFERIDRQFLNLQRTTIRESTTQETLQSEFLSSLWTRIVGPNAATLRKYEKNKSLLASVRAKTTQNKSLLVEHNGKLHALKSNLENLRRKLVSPLVRGAGGMGQGGSTVGVEEQIRGLEGTYDYLRKVREVQKGRVLEVLYGAGGGSGRRGLGREGVVGIEGS